MFRTLSLNNFGHHRDRVFEFSPTTLIVGANGSGKTTILNALKGSITGDWGCTKAEAITVGAVGPSKVTAILEAASGVFGVTRYLSSEQAFITDAAGQKTISGATAVGKEALARLDTTKAILDELVFTDQGEIGRIISGTRSQRQSALMRLFGVERMEKISEVIRVPVATPLTAYDPHIDQARAAIETDRAAITEGQLYLDTHPPQQLFDAATDPDLLIQRNFLVYIDYWKTRRDAEQKMQETEVALLKASADLDSAQEELQTLEGAKHLQGAEAERAKAILMRYEATEKARKAREKLQSDLTKLQQDAVRYATPAPPVGYEADLEVRAAWQRSLAECHTELGQARTYVNKWASRQACPECGRDAPELKAKADALQARIAPLERDIKTLNAAVSLCAEFDLVLQKWHTWKTFNDSNIAALTKQLEDTQEVAAEAANPEELKNVLLEDERLANAVKGLAATERQLASVYATAAGAAGSAIARLEQVMALPEVQPVTDEENAQAVTRYAERQRYIAERATQEANQASRLSNIGQREANLAKLLQDKERAGQEHTATAYMTLLKEMFGRNGLPARITAAYLNQVCANVNMFLTSFAMPFRVEVDVKNQFLSPLTPQGLTYSSGRLSGGQKAALAISFKAAVVSRFADKVGALILDEPTESMDIQNVRALGQVFSRLREVASAHKLQVIAVTHSMELAPYFDRVISL